MNVTLSQASWNTTRSCKNKLCPMAVHLLIPPWSVPISKRMCSTKFAKYISVINYLCLVKPMESAMTLHNPLPDWISQHDNKKQRRIPESIEASKRPMLLAHYTTLQIISMSWSCVCKPCRSPAFLVLKWVQSCDLIKKKCPTPSSDHPKLSP